MIGYSIFSVNKIRQQLCFPEHFQTWKRPNNPSKLSLDCPDKSSTQNNEMDDKFKTDGLFRSEKNNTIKRTKNWTNKQI